MSQTGVSQTRLLPLKWAIGTDRASWYSSPYRIYRTTQGYDCWLFDEKRQGVLGRGLKTLGSAQDFCEKHRGRA